MSKLLKLSLIVSSRGKSLISDFLLGQNASSVAEDLSESGELEVSGYFSMDTDLIGVIARLKNYVSILDTIAQGVYIEDINVEEIDPSSWESWKKQLKTVKAGDRFVIRPPWEEYSPRNNEIVIEINPSVAFGTGHHETTRLCIRGIEEIMRRKRAKRIFDLGCGSGILSIVAAFLGAEEIVALDMDPAAVTEAKINLEKNSVRRMVELVCGDIRSIKDNFDLIVANISLETILDTKNELRIRLRENGLLLVSGVLHSERDELMSGMEEACLINTDEYKDGQWIAVVFHIDKIPH
jgi:ribosomal protein L11 methyltransferase